MPPTELFVSDKAHLEITHSYGGRRRSSAANPVIFIFYSQHQSRFYLAPGVNCKNPGNRSNILHTLHFVVSCIFYLFYFYIAKVAQVTVLLHQLTILNQ